MKKVVLVELHIDAEAKSESVIESVMRFANKEAVTTEDHDNLAAINRVVKIHETKAHG